MGMNLTNWLTQDVQLSLKTSNHSLMYTLGRELRNNRLIIWPPEEEQNMVISNIEIEKFCSSFRKAAFGGFMKQLDVIFETEEKEVLK